MGLNKAQAEAVAHKEGPCMVLAGPGSGKTLTIAKRIEYLINNYQVRPEEILVVTFTKLASAQMKSRFLKITKSTHSLVTFGTFHGIFYGILKWAYKMNAGNILSEEEKSGLLRQSVRQMELDLEEDKDFYKDLSAEIGNIKNNQADIDEYEATCCPSGTFRDIFHKYEHERKSRKKIDFDDMLVLCYDLFEKRPDVLQLWQDKFRYILIDEFQDINRVQYEVIRRLAAPRNNLFIVGDDDQSIYRFRGAKPEIMLGFKEDYKDTRTILLDVNYRSTKAIVDGAQRVINQNSHRYPKQIITTNEQGCTVHVQEVLHPIEESKYVIEKMNETVKQGVLPSDIAVLFRTNTEARALAETLTEYNIPFQMKEHLPNLYEHFIAKDMMAYISMAQGGRERKDFLQIMNRPNRYIGRDAVEGTLISFEKMKSFYGEREWMQDRIDQFELDLRVLKNVTPYAAIQYIRKRVGYDEFLKEYAAFRKMELADLKEVLKDIEDRAKNYRTSKEWFQHIAEYTEELKKQAGRQNYDGEALSLMTMHGAKGLEYHTVFIIGANETLTPHKKAEIAEEIEEERRMFYVAMTRAKRQLIISYTKERSGKDMEPSRFVTELLTQK